VISRSLTVPEAFGAIFDPHFTAIHRYRAAYLRQRVVSQLPGKPPAPLTPRCSPVGAGYGRHTPEGAVITGSG